MPGMGEAPAKPPAVTMGAILAMVFLDTPAFVRSFAEAYGLPATIFFAVAAPTPGSVWRSLGLAVFKSIGGTRTSLAGFFTAAPVTEAVTRNAQASTASRYLPKYARVAQRVAARLRIDAQSMWAFADRDLRQQLTIVSIDRINFLAVTAGEP